MNILMVSSESGPFTKTGGLADVVYSLSKEMVSLNNNVSIVMPLYGKNIKPNFPTPLKLVKSFTVKLSWRRQIAKVFQTSYQGITYYLIGNDYYFGRDGIYGYQDDDERFAFFTLAVRDMIKQLKLEIDIINVHDWQPGMLPVLIKEQNHKSILFNKIKFVLTIHNPAFQGMFYEGNLSDYYGLPMNLFYNGNVRFKEKASSLKAAIMYVDKITTVSPTHAKELLTREGSKGLDEVIKYRKDDFVGIINGIDNEEFDPTNDRYLTTKYSNETLNNKQILKKEFAKAHNFVNPDAPLFVLVSRLTWQKGIDLILKAVPYLIGEKANIFILGSGEYDYEQGFENLLRRYSKNIGIYIGYNDELAHKIYAAGDFFLMPSLFEPCGIGQMIAMRYGTLPIVRSTGGLKDSVVGYTGNNSASATGISFDNYNDHEFYLALKKSLDVYKDNKTFTKLRVNAMGYDSTWSSSAKKYLDLYKLAISTK